MSLAVPAQTEDVESLQEEIRQLKRRVFQLQRHVELDEQLALKRPARSGTPDFDDLSLPIPNQLCSFLDREETKDADLDEDQRFYRENGYLIKPNLIPEGLTEQYLAERRAVTNESFSVWGGSYMDLEAMRSVCLCDPLVECIEKLIGKRVGLFLTLSGLKSTKRSWHQDFYLKTGYQNVDYCAVWIAISDVHPDSGPYQFVPGTHRWGPLRRELIWDWLKAHQRDTPGATRFAEKFVTDACMNKIRESNSTIKTHLPKRGDVLIWHHSLLHQGSVPRNPDLERPGLISHYNSLHTLRLLGRPIARAENGNYYVPRNDRDRIVEKRAQEQH